MDSKQYTIKFIIFFLNPSYETSWLFKSNYLFDHNLSICFLILWYTLMPVSSMMLRNRYQFIFYGSLFNFLQHIMQNFVEIPLQICLNVFTFIKHRIYCKSLRSVFYLFCWVKFSFSYFTWLISIYYKYKRLRILFESIFAYIMDVRFFWYML